MKCEIIKVHEYSCKNCGRKFNRESNMNRHYKTCKVDEKAKLENKIMEIEKQRDEYRIMLDEHKKQIDDQKIQIKELQNKLENLAKEAIRRPTTSNTTTTIYRI